MTSWSKCSLPSHCVLGLTSTQKPRGTSSPEISSALTSKLRNHQIFGATKSSTAAAAAAIMLQQQLFMSRGAGTGVGESGLIQIHFLWVPSTTSLMGPCLSKLRSEFWICLVYYI
ncbi:hypothetical protein CFP56_028200 [Quercus suber]|uniref:Uncharacterized protein n=1 Tax=Quercus suber TaxID=58331 RepID=A0AAW0JUP5_QUESU|nr:hypothetical protein CFP56_39958 [Quercus suber]